MATVPRARNGDVHLEWEERGPADGEPVLLVMGLGAQLTAWREGFCDLLASAGYRVVRFDNRDSGLSSFTAGRPPSTASLARAVLGGRRFGGARYTLSDMAADAVAVLDAAGAHRAHVVGASLGGMIAQTVAIEHPGRVASLTSIMSRTGAPFAGLPTPRVLRTVLRSTPTEPEAALAYELERSSVICGPLFDPDATLQHLREAQERSPVRTGMAFQLAAILASGDRTRALRRVEVPTVVLHGRADGLVRPSGGRATARAVPGAELVLFDEMGHDLPPAVWDRVAEAIVGVARRAPIEPERHLSNSV